MFTGIIQAIGSIATIERQAQARRFLIKTNNLPLTTVKIGDSIATNGVCLTATELLADAFWADVSLETLNCSTLGDLSINAAVNLELAMTPQQHFGGHIVLGHVDGIGSVKSITKIANSVVFELEAAADLAKYIAAKGSITIDGTSLTVNEVNANRFAVNIVPHTIANTIIANYKIGTVVNLEVDIIARYLERLLEGRHLSNSKEQNKKPLSVQTLYDAGML